MSATRYKFAWFLYTALGLVVFSGCTKTETKVEVQQVEPMKQISVELENPESLKGFSYLTGTGFGSLDSFTLFMNAKISKDFTFRKGKKNTLVIKGGGEVIKNEGPQVRVLLDNKEIAKLQFTKPKEEKEVNIPPGILKANVSLEFINDYYEESTKADRNMEFISVTVKAR